MADRKLSWGEAFAESGRRFKDSYWGKNLKGLADLLAPDSEDEAPSGPYSLPADRAVFDAEHEGVSEKRTARNRAIAGALAKDAYEGVDRPRAALTGEKPVERDGEGFVGPGEAAWGFNTAGNLMLGGRATAAIAPKTAQGAEGAAGVFIGQKGAKNLGKDGELEVAKKLYEEGFPIEDIRRETGWSFGPRGEHDWQFEISDHNMRFKPKAFVDYGTGRYVNDRPTLGDTIDHPEWFQAYPESKDIEVAFQHGPDVGPGGVFDSENQIIKAQGLDAQEVREILAHELQHTSDGFEKKAGGSSPAWTKEVMENSRRHLPPGMREAYDALPSKEKQAMAYRRYRHDAGEVNAETTRNRIDMTPEERRETAPSASYPADINPDLITLGPASATYESAVKPEMALPPDRFTPGKLGDEYERLDVDVKKLDRDWSRDKDMYIGKGGENGIGDRYSGFGRWLDVNPDTPIEMPRLGSGTLPSRPEGHGTPTFGDGRHRFAYLRDQGETTVPMMVNKEDAPLLRERYGAAPAAPSPAGEVQGHGVRAAGNGKVASRRGPTKEALADAIDRAEKTSAARAEGKKVFSAKNPPKNQKQLPNLRNMELADALKLAKKDPHLIPSNDGSEGIYKGAPRDIQSRRGLTNQRKKLDANLDIRPEGGDWYDRFRGAITEVTGGDPVKNEWMSKTHGQFSAGVDPGSEAGFSIKETNGFVAGMPVKAARPAQHEAMARAIEANNPDLMQLGDKTGEYAKKINPDLNAEPRATGVNDFRWARELGYTEPDGSPQTNALGSAQHKFADYETAQAVNRANDRNLDGRNDWTGEQVQAVGWINQKAKDFGERYKNWTPEEAYEHANTTLADFLDKHTAYATHEHLPGSYTGHLPKLQDASPELKDAYAIDPRSTWATAPGGRDAIYNGYGLPETDMGVSMRVRPTTEMRGIYTPENGPTEFNRGEVARPLVAFDTDAKGHHSLAPADRALMDAAESVRGYVDAQNGGAYHKPQVNVSGAEAGSLRIPMDRALTAEEAGKLSAVGKKHGYPDVSDTGRGVTMTNFLNPPTGDHARAAIKGVKANPKKGIEGKSGVLADILEAVPESGEPFRIKTDGNYLGYERWDVPEDHPEHGKSRWSEQPGQGHVTRELLRRLDETTPQIRGALDRNADISERAGAKRERDADWASRLDDTVREDIQNARRIIAEGPGWQQRLKDALARGELLPAAVAALGLGAALRGHESER